MTVNIEVKNCDAVGTLGRHLLVLERTIEDGALRYTVLRSLGPQETFPVAVWQDRSLLLAEQLGPVPPTAFVTPPDETLPGDVNR